MVSQTGRDKRGIEGGRDRLGVQQPAITQSLYKKNTKEDQPCTEDCYPFAVLLAPLGLRWCIRRPGICQGCPLQAQIALVQMRRVCALRVLLCNARRAAHAGQPCSIAHGDRPVHLRA